MSDASEENNNDLESLLERLVLEHGEEKLANLAALFSSRYPQTSDPQPQVPQPPHPQPALDYESYFKENNEAVNIMGFAKTADLLGYDDVEEVTAQVERYTVSQRQILTIINKKFKTDGIKQVKKKKKEEEDDENKGDNKQQKDLKQILMSKENSHFVDLLAKHTIKDVAEEYGLTNEDLKVAVEEHEELITSLEDKVKEEKKKAKKLKASSSQGRTKK
ncbi:hypothetical protein Tco_1213737 [Tanacetum coccineum]